MKRRTLLHWMIQSLGNTDALQERVVTVAYGVPLHLAPPQSADLTTLQPSIRFGNNAAPHSERCTGKTHMLYLATWHYTVVGRGNVAYCLAFSVQVHGDRRPSAHAFLGIITKSILFWKRIINQQSEICFRPK